MTTLLQINSSLFEDHGTSSTLADRLVARLRAAQPALRTSRRDLGREPLAHFDATLLKALSTPAAERTTTQSQLVAEADALIAEVQAADVLVIGVPLYNFGVPSQLKSWFDRIARAGVTFRYTANGPEGLLKGKKVYVVTARGGVHRDAPTDHAVPFLRTMLAFVGITDVEVIYAEGLAMGAEPRAAGIASAEAAIDALVPIAADARDAVAA